MSRLIKILFPVGLAALVAAGCESLPGAGDVPAPEDEVTLRACIADISTKTHMGTQTGNVIPVYWSEGDRINVNGTESSPLSEGQYTDTDAEFVVRNVSAPYYAVYPASAYQSSDKSGRNAMILIPDTQKYSPSSFGEGAAVLYGSAEAGGSLTFQNLCGAIRVSITDDEEGVLKSFNLSYNSEDEFLAGYFSIDLQTGALEYVEVTNSVDLELPEEGVALSKTEPRSFFLTIPAGSYPEGFTITMTTADNRTMKCKWLRESAGAEEGVTVSAGKLVNFGPFAFEGIRQIVDADSWNSFATAVNAGGDAWKKWADENGVVRLAADIEVDGDLVAINDWAGEFLGQEYTITRNGATKPLFKSVSGIVQDLNIDGSFTPAVPYKTAPLVGEIVAGGSLIQCNSSVDISWNGEANAAIGGIAGSITIVPPGDDMGVVTGCQNSGTINVTENCTNGAKKLYVGGIVALIDELDNTAFVDECINTGRITVTTTDPAKGLDGSGIGGIVGAITAGDDNCYASIWDSENSGAVTFNTTPATSAAYKGVYVGGIVGLCGNVTNGVIDNAVGGHIYLEFENCSNSGEVKNGGVSAASSDKLYQKVYTGGIAGVAIGLPDSHIPMTGCSNTGDVRSHEGGYSRAGVCGNTGGLVGLGGYIDIEGCSVHAKVGTTGRQSYSVGGVAATMATTFSINDCDIYADLEMIQSSDSQMNNVDHYALGVVVSTRYSSALSLAGSEISNCRFGGSLTLGTVTSYTAPAMPSATKTTFTTETYSKCIVSPGYTGSDIVLSGNSFLSGN